MPSIASRYEIRFFSPFSGGWWNRKIAISLIKKFIVRSAHLCSFHNIRARQMEIGKFIRSSEHQTKKYKNYLFLFVSNIYDQIEMFSEIVNILWECRHIISINNDNNFSGNVKCARNDLSQAAMLTGTVYRAYFNVRFAQT